MHLLERAIDHKGRDAREIESAILNTDVLTEDDLSLYRYKLDRLDEY
jgi:hypothetical protein